MSRICANCKYNYSSNHTQTCSGDSADYIPFFKCDLDIIHIPTYNGYCPLHVYDSEKNDNSETKQSELCRMRQNPITLLESLTGKHLNFIERLTLVRFHKHM